MEENGICHFSAGILLRYVLHKMSGVQLEVVILFISRSCIILAQYFIEYEECSISTVR